MEKETNEASVALSSLLEKEMQLSQKYEEYLNQEHEQGGNGTTSTKDIEPEVFLGKQTKFFDQLKLFLTAQQISLKQNLMLLETKTAKMKEFRGKPPEQDSMSYAGGKLADEDLEKLHENIAMDALHQWGNPNNVKDENIQICPVCGLEFENSDNSDALEDHVVSHWCSSEPI